MTGEKTYNLIHDCKKPCSLTNRLSKKNPATQVKTEEKRFKKPYNPSRELREKASSQVVIGEITFQPTIGRKKILCNIAYKS